VKYILMMQFKMGGWSKGNISNWTPEDARANRGFLDRLNKDLAEAGELVSVVGLGGPEQMTLVQAQKDGTAMVTDGPFAESKEFLAGYWIVDVDGPERAHQIAARISALPGPGGAPANLPVEVRPVMRAASGDV
jgi:hypothetical protein